MFVGRLVRLLQLTILTLTHHGVHWAQAQGPDSFAFAFTRAARREQARARKLPSQLVAELAKATALSSEAWRQARKHSDFAAFAPHLDRVMALNRAKAEALAVGKRPYDSLLDLYEPDARASEVEAVFRTLRQGLVPLVREIMARQLRALPEAAWGQFILHPERGRITLERWLELYVGHLDTHLAQMARTYQAFQKS